MLVEQIGGDSAGRGQIRDEPSGRQVHTLLGEPQCTPGILECLAILGEANRMQTVPAQADSQFRLVPA